MEWSRANGQDGEMLKRIVAVLFSLAALAEHAGARAGLLRACVLWFLRRAEAVARAFAVESRVPLDRPDRSSPRADVSSEAARLAASFRALAVALDGLARHVRRLARWRVERRIDADAHPNASVDAAHRPPYADTS